MGAQIAIIRDIVESKPVGHCLKQHIALNFRLTFERELLSPLEFLLIMGILDLGEIVLIVILTVNYTTADDSRMYIQSLRNTNHLCSVLCQRLKWLMPQRM